MHVDLVRVVYLYVHVTRTLVNVHVFFSGLVNNTCTLTEVKTFVRKTNEHIHKSHCSFRRFSFVIQQKRAMGY